MYTPPAGGYWDRWVRVVQGAYSGISLSTEESTLWPRVTVASVIDAELYQSVERPFDAFVRAVGTGSASSVMGVVGLRALEIAQAIQDAAAFGRTVALETGVDARA